MSSFWIPQTEKTTSFPTVNKEMDVSIAIIGGGFTGLHTAYQLLCHRQDCIILEKETIASKASAHTLGMLTSQHGLLYQDLSKRYGYDFAKQYYTLHQQAIKQIQQIQERHHFSCDFQPCDCIYQATAENEKEALIKEYESYQILQIPSQLKDDKLTMHYQACINPNAYAHALAHYLHTQQVPIYQQSPVETITKENHGYTLRCNQVDIHADYVIIATQLPFAFWQPNHVICMEDEDWYLSFQKQTTPTTTLIQTNQEIRRSSTQGTLLASKTPSKDGVKVEAQTTQDHIAIIGKLDKEVETFLIATGYSCWGITTSLIAGWIFCDHILHRQSDARRLYSYQRFE